MTVGPFGAQIHFSRDKCNDFSCRVQSYFDLKVSVQKVHWKILFRSSDCLRPTAAVVGRRLRRLSFLPAKLELKELKEPCVDCDDKLEMAALDAESDEV